MEIMSEEQLQSVKAAIRKVAPEPVRLINSYVKSDRTGQKVLKTNNIKSIKISRDVREFHTTTPCYIKFVDLYSADPALIEKRVVFVAVKFDGSQYKIEPKIINLSGNDGAIVPAVRYEVRSFCSAIRLSAETVLRKVATSKFMAYGFSLDQIDSSAKRVEETITLVNGIDDYASSKLAEAAEAERNKVLAEERKAELEGEIGDLERQEVSLSSQIGELQKNVDLKTEEKKTAEKDVVEYQAKLSSAQNNETQLKQSADALNREIVRRRDELKSIVNDRSLISDEYRDYVVEGKKQSRVYEWFLYFSVAIICVCAWQLYSGAQRILFAEARDYQDILTLVLQRAPFAAAISLVVGVAWKLAAMFVSRIMAIHAQRLALARLLVIAKDTVYSSADGLDITDEQKFRERIRLKLLMLRSHLTSELGRDFDYRVDAEKGRDEIEGIAEEKELSVPWEQGKD